MALKALLLRRDINKVNEQLAELRAKDAEFTTREAELEAAIGEAETDEQREAVGEEVEAFEAEKAAHEGQKEALGAKLDELVQELEEEERKKAVPARDERKPERREATMNKINIRALPKSQRAFDAFDQETRAAIVAREDVKQFLAELRSLKGQKRAVSGAGLTIPVTLLDIIAENMYRYSKLLNRVRVRPVKGEARQTVAGTIPEGVWTEMCGIINELDFVFNQVTLDGYKVAGFIPVCNSDLEDSDINLASTIVEMISEAIGLAMDKAILYGKGGGNKMPLGIVTRLAQSSKPESYPANAPAWVDLHTSNIKVINGDSLSSVEFWAALTEACGNTFTKYSRGEQFWAMNSKTYNYLKSKAITFTASGDIVANVFALLPIINGDIDILEFMPDYDIVGGYGDLYLLSQRAGMVIDSSEHVQFIQDNTVFRGKQRADGMPVIAGAFVAINVKNTSVTTSMVFAGDSANTVTGILLPTAASVAGGSKIQLKAVLVPFGVEGDISYASATTAKATVNSVTGEVTGVTTGSSVITATCGDYSASCTVTVS